VDRLRTDVDQLRRLATEFQDTLARSAPTSTSSSGTWPP
jgi:hypothetical protein